MTQVTSEKSMLGLLGAAWAVGGFSLILLDAINRLTRIALHAFEGGALTPAQLLFLVFAVVFMAYCEGYRGFQKSFSPRCAARVYYLYRNPEPLAVLLAPLFCIGFFRATRAPLLFAWVGTGLIVLFIIALQVSPQPWRGLFDVGVVVGLSWGLVSFLISVWRVFSSGEPAASAEVPVKNPV